MLENASSPAQLPWYVAHTRPRSEKKLAEYCDEQGFVHSLPLYRSVKKYRGKRVVFHKPLFPNYLFLRIQPEDRAKILQNRHVANLLTVPDQAEFEQQLGGILTALDTDYDICVLPEIKAGVRVRIKSGPLRGLEAWVESREKLANVQLRLDFIGQAAVVALEAELLELA
ncbi:MAG TPA: transcription termination/antitermination NusG family protein [Candidatus Limnocylindria bacterium]|nr:transcription termination/antitermination NusG family protein [Candidatus Limnocylindria bacterium]